MAGLVQRVQEGFTLMLRDFGSEGLEGWGQLGTGITGCLSLSPL